MQNVGLVFSVYRVRIKAPSSKFLRSLLNSCISPASISSSSSIAPGTVDGGHAGLAEFPHAVFRRILGGPFYL